MGRMVVAPSRFLASFDENSHGWKEEKETHRYKCN
jgi:hypothetical protein